jgi:hypothetical protein
MVLLRLICHLSVQYFMYLIFEWFDKRNIEIFVPFKVDQLLQFLGHGAGFEWTQNDQEMTIYR